MHSPLLISAAGAARQNGLAIALAVSLLATSQASAQFVKGVDVYNGDGAVNWTSVKNGGYEFAFVKLDLPSPRPCCPSCSPKATPLRQRLRRAGRRTRTLRRARPLASREAVI